MRRPLLLILPLLLGVAPGLAAARVDDPEALADLAVEQQPSIDAIEARVEALQAVASAARVWTDPVIGVELSNLPVTAPWFDQHPMAGVQLKLQQRFPAPGQTRARAAAAGARIDATSAERDVLANALRGEVRSRYQDLALVRQLRDLTAVHVTELDRLIGAVEARYQVGGADQHDLLQLQLRRDRLAEVLPDLDARADAITATLNGALARDPATPIGTPDASPVEPLPGDASSRAAALAQHPRLAVLKAQAAAERAEADRARTEAVPGPTAWLGYRIRAPQTNGDPGSNFASAGVSLPLPAASTRHWTAMASAAEARARAAEQAAAATEARLLAQLAAAEARYTRAADRAAAYRDSLESSARAALDSTSSAYSVDRAGFADLIRAEIDLLEVRRQRLRAEADVAQARAEIVTLLGDARPASGSPGGSP